jgi:hypothetical protein
MKLLAYALALMMAPAALAQTAAPQPQIPTVDAESGPCSVTFTVLDGHGGPVEGALLRLDADYGFLGLHNLDIQLRTNAKGRARFVGLPDSADGVFYFEASTDELKGIAVANPRYACNVGHAIIMAPPTTAVAKTEE